MLSLLLPDTLKQVAYYRYYHARHKVYAKLFERANLALAPSIAMHDLILGDVISGNIAFHGFYELGLSKKICHLANVGGTLVDVGANMGYFSLLWAGSNPNAKAITFEAAPRNIALLANNVEKNRLTTQIQQIGKAASHSNGMITFDLGPTEQTGWGGISRSISNTSIEVASVRIDEELKDTVIDVLKIDVEGADTWVLFGCEDLLKKKKIKNIFFEQNPSRMREMGISESEAKNFLNALGYDCVPFDTVQGEWHAYPKPVHP